MGTADTDKKTTRYKKMAFCGPCGFRSRLKDALFTLDASTRRNPLMSHARLAVLHSPSRAAQRDPRHAHGELQEDDIGDVAILCANTFKYLALPAHTRTFAVVVDYLS